MSLSPGGAVDQIGRADALWLSVAVAAQLASVSCLARVQHLMLAGAGVRVRAYRMTALTYAANAVSATLPGGTALATGYTFRRLRSWGASAPVATFTVFASGVLSVVTFAALVVVWTLTASTGSPAALLGCAPVAVLTAGLVAQRERTLRAISRVVRATCAVTNRLRRRPRHAGVHRIERFFADLRVIRLRRRDWLAGTAAASLNWLADLVSLIASCHAVGAGRATIGVLTAAYLAGKSTSSVSVLPAGMGISDVAMTVTLHGGGVSATHAAAAVLCYRLISVALLMAIGWAIYALGISRIRRSRRLPNVAGTAHPITHLKETPCQPISPRLHARPMHPRVAADAA